MADVALPGVIAEIAEVAGHEAAWTIAQTKGGQQVFIPAEARAGHWLIELVGRDAADRICDHFSVAGRGVTVLIPMASAARRAEAISKAVSGDMSANSIAAELGVHRRTAFRYRKKARKQGSLF